MSPFDLQPSLRVAPLATVLFDDLTDEVRFKPDIGQLRVVRVEAPGPRLNAAYELLERVFDPAVIDSKQTYVDLLSPGGLCLDGFPIICLAAVFDFAGDELVVGFLSSNLMWVNKDAKLLQLAIGNIATSPKLKDQGVRGVGTTLLKRAIEIGGSTAHSHSAELGYSVAEAERESLGFWQKFGYRWPKGLNYLQPPLEFADDGSPVHEEVPETFMVYPLGNPGRNTIETRLLREMIFAIYRNWCIETNRRKLSPEAFKTAEAYVMQKVFPRVTQYISKTISFELTAP